MDNNIIQFTDGDYYHNAITKPPNDMTFLDNNTRYTRVVVDSRVRNRSLFPNQNDYEVTLDDDINDVKSAKLLQMEMPMPMYLINSNFNKIYFKIGSTEYTATISIGDYSAVDLVTAMQAAFDAQLISTFFVSYDAVLDNFNINAVTLFTLQFINKVNPLNQLLGFSSEKDYNSVNNGLVPGYSNFVKSEFRRNANYNNYVIMDIEQFDILKSIDRDLNKSFAIIPKNTTLLNIGGGDDFNIIKRFSPPLGRLTKLRIRLFDRFGNAYDFQNMDHRFEILFESFKQRQKYMH